jgi:RNA polymerase sigma-70 factor (ECF subfamily)
VNRFQTLVTLPCETHSRNQTPVEIPYLPALGKVSPTIPFTLLKKSRILAEAFVPHVFHGRSGRQHPSEPVVEPDSSDAELVALAMEDPRHFSLLYARYLDPVHRYCYRRLGTREAAEDATSLVFTKALSAFPHYRHASFRGWLFTIAHHVVTDRYRESQPERPLETVVELRDGSPSPEDLALAADERRSMAELLTHLPDHQRQVVELRLAGLTGAEIAQALGRSPSNVDVTQFRAVARLRVLLGVAATPQEVRDGA